MKARVKATGEIVSINEFCALKDSGERTYYWSNALELLTQDNPDYWTRLEHTYAGMAMQAMLANPEVLQTVTSATELLAKDYAEKVAIVADRYATALVKELKEKEERK